MNLAKREALATIFTVDYEDFDTYRYGADEDVRVRGDARQFDSAARQFWTTVMDASVDVSLIIRKRPSGAMSQLIGPVRIPVSTMSV